MVEAGSPCIDEPLLKVESEKQKCKIMARNCTKKAVNF